MAAVLLFLHPAHPENPIGKPLARRVQRCILGFFLLRSLERIFSR